MARRGGGGSRKKIAEVLLIAGVGVGAYYFIKKMGIGGGPPPPPITGTGFVVVQSLLDAQGRITGYQEINPESQTPPFPTFGQAFDYATVIGDIGPRFFIEELPQDVIFGT